MDIRADLKSIYETAIQAVDPGIAVKSHLKINGKNLQLFSDSGLVREFDLDAFSRIFVVGAGKATASMAKAVESILGNRITGGCISVKYGYTEQLDSIELIEASHPIPDSNGIKGSEKIRDILTSATEKDLIFSLISGGGSALLPLPAGSITLEEMGKATDLLMKSGATIHEMNALRKHMSLVKGGNLAKMAFPATVLNLMISDVVGDNMDVIASGPFVPDYSTFDDAVKILEKYGLTNMIPVSILDYIVLGADGSIEENPVKGSPVFEKITNLIIASNIISLNSAKEEAERKGYNSIILSSMIEGDTTDTAAWHTKIALEVLNSSNPVPPPACIISGGETTVRIKGEGLGGRNMEFALQTAKMIEGNISITAASIGTDGTDGPTDSAGAVADGNTVGKAAQAGLNINKYIDNNDSYHFFKKIDDLIITGPTNTNVMDVRILLVAG